jgi:exodeoxyribonuclease V gamma subunit
VGAHRWGENDDDAIRYVYGPEAPFDRLWGVADEQWSPETTRFGVLARRVWEPLLACEES